MSTFIISKQKRDWKLQNVQYTQARIASGLSVVILCLWLLHPRSSHSKHRHNDPRAIHTPAYPEYSFTYNTLDLSNASQPSFVPHFGGAYGSQALHNLTSWASTLFLRTMLSYREFMKTKCRGQVAECAAAATRRQYDEPQGFSKYDLFNPMVTCPGGRPVQRMGGNASFEDDGGKFLCMDLLKPPCSILSLGSNGDFTFEEAMLKSTQCNIFTFDCTYDGHSIHGRHQYYKKCLGSPARAAKDASFTTLEAAANWLGVERINLLKIDVEGFEYDVLSEWTQTDLALPEQIAIEIHHSEVIYYPNAINVKTDFSNLLWPMHNLSMSDLALFFHHLSSLGYGIVSREDNPLGKCCSEFLLMKVGDWVPLRSKIKAGH